MGFFKIITNFFESLFSNSSTDSKTKSELKKIEAELKLHSPAIYKNGFVLEGIAEAFYILFTESKYIETILAETVCSEDKQNAQRFANKLIMTGFSSETQELYEALSYENKKEVILSSEDSSEAFEEQDKLFARFLGFFHQPEFYQINSVLGRLEQLYDICRFNYFSTLRTFNPDFSSDRDFYDYAIHPLPVNTLEVVFMDLFYICAGFQLTNTVAKAILALASLRYGPESVNQEMLLSSMKKISYVLRHVLTTDNLQKLIYICKKDILVRPQFAEYSSNALNDFVETLKKQYALDKQRIETEVQDEEVAMETKQLFGNVQLEVLEGYNSEQDTFLRQNSALPFLWITPLQILKTFLTYFLDDKIKTLLNDIVVEGYFNNSTYKSDFSAVVFSALECSERVKTFEDSFGRGHENDIALIRSYVRDGHQDPDFAKKLSHMINQINNQAKSLIQNEITQIVNLSYKLEEIIEDSKTVNPTHISNIKILFYSTRNKENANQLESNFPNWKLFLDIMKKYAIIGSIG